MDKRFYFVSIIACCSVTIVASVYAITSSAALVTAMKAVTHSFTLTSDLNSGQTELQSGPLTGKKEGELVTALEYNRMLEVSAQRSNLQSSCQFIRYEADCKDTGCTGDEVASSFKFSPKASSSLGQSVHVKVACASKQQILSGYAYSMGSDEVAEQSVDSTKSTVTCRGTSMQNTDTLHFTCGAICLDCSGTPVTPPADPGFTISCDWSGWYTSRTHGGDYPTGGKGNTMGFYCDSGDLKSVKWNKWDGTADTTPEKGISCNFSGSQAMDPQDFDGGSDEYKVICKGWYLTGITARINNWDAGDTVKPGEQPTCTISLKTWANGIGYTCKKGLITQIQKP